MCYIAAVCDGDDGGARIKAPRNKGRRAGEREREREGGERKEN